ncbi:hypothetical protein L596_009086 [Steinernema carpocapsae]|uniref:Uncharacterized protein n=1 Tax=Steinernema carpocapsae TaxID=34508 RepID=A0A4U5PEE5_STECR|nr:hypothetical protein L596_009086 [Steinernema carpocapsae]
MRTPKCLFLFAHMIVDCRFPRFPVPASVPLIWVRDQNRADFLVYITDLRKKFFEILNAIRYGERPSDENVGQTPPLRFRILCKLIPETSTVQRPREFVWQKVDAEAVNDALLLPCGTRIDNPIVQADLYGREHRCEEREEEK